MNGRIFQPEADPPLAERCNLKKIGTIIKSGKSYV